MIEVCFWEIFANGQRPYNNLKVDAVVSRLLNGDLFPQCEREWPITSILENLFQTNKELEPSHSKARELYHELANIAVPFEMKHDQSAVDL